MAIPERTTPALGAGMPARAFRKLDIESRAQLVAALFDGL